MNITIIPMIINLPFAAVYGNLEKEGFKIESVLLDDEGLQYTEGIDSLKTMRIIGMLLEDFEGMEIAEECLDYEAEGGVYYRDLSPTERARVKDSLELQFQAEISPLKERISFASLLSW